MKQPWMLRYFCGDYILGHEFEYTLSHQERNSASVFENGKFSLRSKTEWRGRLYRCKVCNLPIAITHVPNYRAHSSIDIIRIMGDCDEIMMDKALR